MTEFRINADFSARIVVTPQDRVREHIDHWDAGRHLHERIPILGRLVAFVRRKVSAG